MIGHETSTVDPANGYFHAGTGITSFVVAELPKPPPKVVGRISSGQRSRKKFFLQYVFGPVQIPGVPQSSVDQGRPESGDSFGPVGGSRGGPSTWDERP